MTRDKYIDYLEIPAKDLDVAKTFFSNVFGWTFVDYGDEYCAFNDGRMDGGFFKADFCVTSQTSVLIVFHKSDLEPWIATIEDAGGTIIKDIFEFPGGRRFHFTDPNGNEFAIWSENESQNN